MFAIVKRFHFCYGHRLLDYEGKCSHPHGHNGLLEIELSTSQLDQRGMVCDFGDVKEILGPFIDGELDHRMILREDDPLAKALTDLGETPFLMSENPTAENIAKLVFREAKQCGLPVTAVRLWESPDSFAEFRNS